jgi:hypothetical protein
MTDNDVAGNRASLKAGLGTSIVQAHKLIGVSWPSEPAPRRHRQEMGVLADKIVCGVNKFAKGGYRRPAEFARCCERLSKGRNCTCA